MGVGARGFVGLHTMRVVLIGSLGFRFPGCLTQSSKTDEQSIVHSFFNTQGGSLFLFQVSTSKQVSGGNGGEQSKDKFWQSMVTHKTESLCLCQGFLLGGGD